jgi:Flp pilus assembly protein TadB
MILDAYVAVLGALAVGGVLLVILGLRGTTEAPRRFESPVATGRLARWWRGAGVTATERRTRQAMLIAAIAVTFTVYIAFQVPAVALLAGVAVPGVPWLWSVGKREERAIARAEALGDWTRRLKDHISTGTGLTSAIVATAETAPTVIADQVYTLTARLQAGMDPRRALYQFAADLDDPIAEQVVAVLLLHLADRGEHLAEVLSAIAGDTAKQVSMRREVHAKRTQPRTTVRFMTVFGLIVAAILGRGDLLSAYATPAGQLVLLALASGFVATMVWVRSMSKPPAQPRFLRMPEGLS